jgi:hypothetical protein
MRSNILLAGAAAMLLSSIGMTGAHAQLSPARLQADSEHKDPSAADTAVAKDEAKDAKKDAKVAKSKAKIAAHKEKVAVTKAGEAAKDEASEDHMISYADLAKKDDEMAKKDEKMAKHKAKAAKKEADVAVKDAAAK